MDLLPNRGAVVRRVTAREVREVCQVRRVLECEATRRACGRIELAELHALAADLRRLRSIESPSPREIVAKTRIGNDWLVDKGLNPNELVVVDGISKVRPGAVVKPVIATQGPGSAGPDANKAAQPETVRAPPATPPTPK